MVTRKFTALPRKCPHCGAEEPEVQAYHYAVYVQDVSLPDSGIIWPHGDHDDNAQFGDWVEEASETPYYYDFAWGCCGNSVSEGLQKALAESLGVHLYDFSDIDRQWIEVHRAEKT